MSLEEPIINRVANSGLITLDLEEYFPSVEIAEIDLKELLVEGLMLREKDLREFVRTHDWSQHQHQVLAVHCTADAVIPTWAYMLIGIAAQPYARRVVFGNREAAITVIYMETLGKIDWDNYREAKVVVKGCSDVKVPEAVYLEAAIRLRAVAATIMYGEPCSTVPLFKRSKPSA